MNRTADGLGCQFNAAIDGADRQLHTVVRQLNVAHSTHTSTSPERQVKHVPHGLTEARPWRTNHDTPTSRTSHTPVRNIIARTLSTATAPPDLYK
jgi:hypothetical protein